jgi:hypothetical protein
VSFYSKPKNYTNASTSKPFEGVPRFQQRGDRTLVQRQAEPEPEYRRKGETLEGRKKVGLTNNVVLDRLPRGCLFKVAGGFFDLDGYWCVPKADHYTEVRRGSSKKIMRLLTPAQKKELARVRLNARRRKVR